MCPVHQRACALFACNHTSGQTLQPTAERVKAKQCICPTLLVGQSHGHVVLAQTACLMPAALKKLLRIGFDSSASRTMSVSYNLCILGCRQCVRSAASHLGHEHFHFPHDHPPDLRLHLLQLPALLHLGEAMGHPPEVILGPDSLQAANQ